MDTSTSLKKSVNKLICYRSEIALTIARKPKIQDISKEESNWLFIKTFITLCFN